MRGGRRLLKPDRQVAAAMPLFDSFYDLPSQVMPEEFDQTDEPQLAGERLEDACRAWWKQGGEIRSIIYTRDSLQSMVTLEPGVRLWHAENETDPFGALLHDTQVYADHLADTVRLLKVNHLWVLGYTHAIDRTESLARERVSKQAAYQFGLRAGHDLIAKNLIVYKVRKKDA